MASSSSECIPRDRTAANRVAEGITDEENSKMQVWFHKAMCDELKIPEGYQHVAVLIIKWAEELDELKCAEEVRELDTITLVW